MKTILKELLKEWEEKELPKIIERDRDPSKLIDWKIFKAIPIVGFRRVGKTFLLLNVAKKMGKENTIYIDFEDERLPKKTEVLTCLSDVIKEIYGRKKLIFLLDEIQNIPHWSKWVRRMLDSFNYQIILSGSTSKLSSKEIPTELRGRCICFELYPLSFPEFLRFKGEDIEKLTDALKLNLLKEYVNFGGLPEIVLSEEAKKYLLIEEYFKTFLVRDIFERYGIRNKELMRNLIRLLLNSTYVTITKIFDTLKSIGHKIGKETVANYLYYLENSLFVEFLEILTPKVKNSLKAPRKVMFIDNFFIKRFSKFSENIGRLMENCVFLQLKRKISENPLAEIYYWKDYQQNEVDFVLREGLKIEQLIQVTYASSKDEIEKREIKALIKASELLKCKNLLIITWDYEDELKIENKIIKCIPLWKWLLLR
ncbi:MAG: ATP-binding protein [Candidatus Aenigmatarchaeota archaeon]